MNTCHCSFPFSRAVVAVAFAGLGATAALGGTISSDILNDPNTIKLTTNDSGYNTSLTNASRWTANSGTVITPQTVSDPMNPNPAAADVIYVVQKSFRTYKDPVSGKISTWGQPLFIGGKEWHVATSFAEAASFEGTPVQCPPISFYDGSSLTVSTAVGFTNTTINIRSGAGNPWTVAAATTQKVYFRGCTFTGQPAAGIKFSNSATDNSSTMTFYLRDNDFSAYKGTIIVNPSTATGYGPSTVVNESGSFSMPGTLSLYDNACAKTRSSSLCTITSNNCAQGSTLQVGAAGRWQFESMTMDNGSKLSFQSLTQYANPCIYVTEAFKLKSGKITVDLQVDAQTPTQPIPLLRLAPAVTTTLTTDMFSLPDDGDVTFTIVSDELGQTLYAQALPVVTMVVTDSTKTSPPYALSPTGGVHWSNNEAVSGGKVYQVAGANMALKFNTDWCKPAAYVFPGAFFKNVGAGGIDFNGGFTSVTFTNHIITGNTAYNCYTGRMTDFLGESMKIVSGDVVFHCYQNGGFSIKVPLTGAGTVVPRWRGKDHSNGFFEMPLLNTGFTGKTRIICEGQGTAGSVDYTPFSSKCITVRAYDQRNFGGPIPSGATTPVYDAMTIMDNQVLKAVKNDANGGTVTFDEPSRGFYIPWRGRIAADADTTFVIKQQVTYAGRLQKIGAGTLALGGTAKFTSAKLDTPYSGDTFLTGTNELEIAQGSLKPLSTNAFVGVSVIFSNATTLVINPLADAAVGQYGLMSTAPGSSVSVPSGKLNVTFENVTVSDENAEVAVATFADETAAAAFTNKLSVLPGKGLIASVKVATNSVDKTVFTVYSTLARRGALLFLK